MPQVFANQRAQHSVEASRMCRQAAFEVGSGEPYARQISPRHPQHAPRVIDTDRPAPRTRDRAQIGPGSASRVQN
jgi:hypothetical protein